MDDRYITLTPQLRSFVDVQVQTGRHGNASEVVREALRRYEDELANEAAQLDEVRAIADAGAAAIARGEYRPISGPADVDALRSSLDAYVRQRVDLDRPAADGDG